jgi:hypothetical protein
MNWARRLEAIGGPLPPVFLAYSLIVWAWIMNADRAGPSVRKETRQRLWGFLGGTSWRGLATAKRCQRGEGGVPLELAKTLALEGANA